jgi:hypothetical protein
VDDKQQFVLIPFKKNNLDILLENKENINK